jgi:hypothetical protein
MAYYHSKEYCQLPKKGFGKVFCGSLKRKKTQCFHWVLLFNDFFKLKFGSGAGT